MLTPMAETSAAFAVTALEVRFRRHPQTSTTFPVQGISAWQSMTVALTPNKSVMVSEMKKMDEECVLTCVSCNLLCHRLKKNKIIPIFMIK